MIFFFQNHRKKKKVHSPLKPPTIPRLKLCGALLLANLLVTVGEALAIPKEQTYAWSDSSIVLSWLDGNPRDFKTYVSNRVTSILKVTSPQLWRHVPTADNPADCASRGMMPKELLSHELWWKGPSWLQVEPIQVPWQPPRKPLFVPEQKVVSCNISCSTSPQWIEERYSSYHKLVAITAWCLKFIHSFTPGRRPKHLTAQELIQAHCLPTPLTSQQLIQAEHFLVKLAQTRSFPRERQALLHDHVIPPSSKLRSLSPFIDKG